MVSYKRHIAKTISWRVIGTLDTWRVIGTLDTMLVSWFITGNWRWGLAIGGIEVVTKMVLYFFHERIWYRYSRFGINKK